MEEKMKNEILRIQQTFLFNMATNKIDRISNLLKSNNNMIKLRFGTENLGLFIAHVLAAYAVGGIIGYESILVLLICIYHLFTKFIVTNICSYNIKLGMKLEKEIYRNLHIIIDDNHIDKVEELEKILRYLDRTNNSLYWKTYIPSPLQRRFMYLFNDDHHFFGHKLLLNKRI